MKKLTKEQIFKICNNGLGFVFHKYKYSHEYMKPLIKKLVREGLVEILTQDKTTITYITKRKKS